MVDHVLPRVPVPEILRVSRKVKATAGIGPGLARWLCASGRWRCLPLRTPEDLVAATATGVLSSPWRRNRHRVILTLGETGGDPARQALERVLSGRPVEPDEAGDPVRFLRPGVEGDEFRMHLECSDAALAAVVLARSKGHALLGRLQELHGRDSVPDRIVLAEAMRAVGRR